MIKSKKMNKNNMLRTSSENTIKKNNINDAIAKGKIEGIERIKGMIGEVVWNRNNGGVCIERDIVNNLYNKINNYYSNIDDMEDTEDMYMYMNVVEKMVYKLKKYRGLKVEWNTKMLKMRLEYEKEKIDLEEYMKIDYLFQLPILPEVLNGYELPFDTANYDFFYFAVTSDKEIFDKLSIWLGSFKKYGLSFFFQYKSYVTTLEDGKDVVDFILCFKRMEGLNIESKLKERFDMEINNVVYSIKKLYDKNDILSYFNRELLFSLYSPKEYILIYLSNEFVIYNFDINLIKYYYLLTYYDRYIDNDMMGNFCLNYKIKINSLKKNNLEQFLYLQIEFNKLIMKQQNGENVTEIEYNFIYYFGEFFKYYVIVPEELNINSIEEIVTKLSEEDVRVFEKELQKLKIKFKGDGIIKRN
jgi:hypothetical protein